MKEMPMSHDLLQISLILIEHLYLNLESSILCQEGKVLCGAKVHFDQARFDCHCRGSSVALSDRALKAPTPTAKQSDCFEGHQGQIRKPRETTLTVK